MQIKSLHELPTNTRFNKVLRYKSFVFVGSSCKDFICISYRTCLVFSVSQKDSMTILEKEKQNYN